MVTGRTPRGRFNISTVFLDEHLEAGRGNRQATVAPQTSWTYKELHENCCRFANAFKTLGLRSGDRILLLLPDSPQWVAAFLGATRLGAIPVPLNIWLTAAEYEYFFADSQAKALVVDSSLARKLAPEWARFGELKWLMVTGEGGADSVELSRRTSVPQTVSVQGLLDAQKSDLDPRDTSVDDPAFWLYSSGTTGQPKGVVHLQGSMLFSADHYAKQLLNMGEDDVVFSAAKLFFAYGLGNSLTFPLRVGARAVLFPGRVTPEAAFKILQEYRPTLFFSVPTLYASMLQHMAGTDLALRFRSLKLCISAGEALPAEIYKHWKERFSVDILDGIGSTEMTHIFISNTPTDCRPGSTGKVVPGYQARIVDESDVDVATGEIGNLLVQGGSSFAHYWGKPQATAAVQDGGWIRTGDKYHADSDGFYWYAGRADDMLKVNGIWVSPFEVESAVMEHPAVLECAVIGAKDENELVKPKAIVVLRNDQPPSEELAASIVAFVKSQVAFYKCPRWIEFADGLPRTVTGKVQRYKLRERELEAAQQASNTQP